MKKLLAILVLGLFLITPSKADDIKDFQIEGMSIGDSLLDYFSEEKILNSIRNYSYVDNEFYAVGFNNENTFKTFETLDIHLKKDDKKYEIYAVDGLNFYLKIKDCYKKKSEVEIEISEQFKNEKKNDSGITKHLVDKSGKSTVDRISWLLDSDGYIALECYYWSQEIKDTKNWGDHLRISVTTKKLDDWLREKAYK